MYLLENFKYLNMFLKFPTLFLFVSLFKNNSLNPVILTICIGLWGHPLEHANLFGATCLQKMDPFSPLKPLIVSNSLAVHAAVFPGLIMCRFCAENNSCCQPMNVSHSITPRRHCCTTVFLFLWSLVLIVLFPPLPWCSPSLLKKGCAIEVPSRGEHSEDTYFLDLNSCGSWY